MKFNIIENQVNGVVREATHKLVAQFLAHGHQVTENGDATVVFNLTTADEPRLFRRKSKSVFVVSLMRQPVMDELQLKAVCYRTLIRTLSNLVVCLVTQEDGSIRAYFTTPEVGFYTLPFDALAVYERIMPVVGACFATDNRLDRDLPERFRTGSPVISEVRRFAAELDTLGVLPLPFPLEDILPERDRKHLYHIFGITGASYGNLSAREAVPQFGDATFWMTGRGVDKRKLGDVGRDILLVKDFDETTGTVQCSVLPDSPDTARVSVDAVEHYLIYKEFPQVGAIVHVHAWIDGVLSTRQNYPCGTWELAREVVALLHTAPDPAHCALGLKNHGLTITGSSLEEIFQRIRGKLQISVPMFA